MDFKTGDPAFPPVLAAVTGDFSGPLLFMPVSGTYTRTRPEWKRVKSHGAPAGAGRAAPAAGFLKGAGSRLASRCA
jgi:hypothetical protein